MSYWNHIHPCHFFRKLFTFNDLNWHIFPSVSSLWSLVKIGIPLLDTFFKSRGVWHTTGKGTLHTPTWRQDITGTYPPVPSTIQPVSTLQPYAWWKRAYPLIFQYYLKAVLVVFVHPFWVSLGSFVELIPLHLVPDNKGSPGICLLHHFTHHWLILSWDIHLVCYPENSYMFLVFQVYVK